MKSMKHFLVFALLIFPGIWSQDWSVTFQSQLCALRGTSPVILCSYRYPSGHNVRDSGWVKQLQDRSVLLSSPRFKFVGNNRNNCSLRINNIGPTHEGSYYFVFETNRDRWASKDHVSVIVRDLTASVRPTTVTEGDLVTLTCHSGCDPQRILQPLWFREQQPVRSTQFRARKEDAGRYFCDLQGAQSKTVSLNVQYAPKNVLLSMRPSEDIVLRSRLTFTCFSDANPPVALSDYSIFKDGRRVTFGQSHIIRKVQISDSGLYHCQASNNIARNGSKLFQSSETPVSVQYPPMNVSISVDSAEVTEGSAVNMTCRSDANPSAVGYSWFRVGPDPSALVPVGSGPVLSLSSVEASDSGLYMCKSRNRHGESNSTEMLLAVRSKASISAPLWAAGGLGVFLLVALVLALFLYRKNRRRLSDKQTTELRQRDSSEAAVETVDHVYANIAVRQTSPADADYSSPDVVYTTVTIKPKKTRQQSQILDSGPEKDDSVIYAIVSKST